MKSIRFVILGVAILAAGGAAYLAMNLAAPEPVKQVKVKRAPQIETVSVLVVSKDIPTGSTITRNTMKWQTWPKKGVSKNFVIRSKNPNGKDEMAGAIARSSFYAGEPIREAKLVRSDRGYMSAILPAGKRAIATVISADTSAGGFILPNDRVDVIMTRRNGKRNGKVSYTTETILTNIRVLAIDQTIEDKEGEKVVVGETATLELGPKEAEILTVAQQMADRLTLALRSLEDSKSASGKSAEHLLSGQDRKTRGNIRIIKFGNSQEILPKK